MPAIPVDAQLIVIEWVYRLSQHSFVDYDTLRACSLVCRAWTPTAQRLLFRRLPSFEGRPRPERGHLLIRALRTSPHLASYVCSITVSVWEEAPSIALPSICTNLQSVYFRGSFPQTWSTGVEQHLRALHLRPVALKVFAELSFVDCIVRMCTGPRVLDIKVVPTSNADTPIAIPVPNTVRSLSVSALTPWSIAPGDGHSQLSELKLRFHERRPAAWLHPLLASGVLPQLRSLTVEGRIPPPEVLDALTQLQSFVVSVLKLWPSDVSLPKSLRHLGYHREAADDEVPSIEQMGNFLGTVRASQNLQLVTAMPDVPGEARAALGEACGVHGVEFVVYRECGLFPWTTNVDWI